MRPFKNLNGRFGFFKSMKNKIKIITIFLGVVIVGGYIWISSSLQEDAIGHELEGIQATVYKSPNCGCCDNYIGYLRRNGLEVDKISTDDMEKIKEQHEIPHDMKSCHTMIIGDYVIEGHIPLEVVAKLIKEKPNIAGIAMPGMPSGSPGMMGGKMSVFTIHSLMHDGGVSVFMEM